MTTSRGWRPDVIPWHEVGHIDAGVIIALFRFIVVVISVGTAATATSATANVSSYGSRRLPTSVLNMPYFTDYIDDRRQLQLMSDELIQNALMTKSSYKSTIHI